MFGSNGAPCIGAIIFQQQSIGMVFGGLSTMKMIAGGGIASGV
jgi:hypothetical protein